jgi:SPP1 gp7 family putative phage head morphogenesis protein
MDFRDSPAELAFRTEIRGITSWSWSDCQDPWVCDACAARDGEVYSIDDEFEPEHPLCRCWLRPEPGS